MKFEEVTLDDDGLRTSIVVKFPLLNAQGRCSGLCGIATDITERKRAESALQKAQRKLRQTLQASNAGLWDWNTVTNEVEFTLEWKRQWDTRTMKSPGASRNGRYACTPRTRSEPWPM